MSLGVGAGGYIGVTSFVAASHPADSCGLNGLPLTPNSVTMLGNGQILKVANHPNLAKYLDIVRGKRQRIAMVSEFWKNSARIALSDLSSKLDILSLCRQVLEALAYLNQMDIVNLNLTPENIMLDDLGQVKLFGYGLGRITEYGRLVAFPIGDPRFTAPDVLLRGMQSESSAGFNAVPDTAATSISSNNAAVDLSPPLTIPDEFRPPDDPHVDVWSLGMIMAARLLNINQLWPQAKVGQVIRKIVSLADCESGAAVLEKLAREHGRSVEIINGCGDASGLDPTVLKLLEACLNPCSEERPSPLRLLNSGLFDCLPSRLSLVHFTLPSFPVIEMRSKRMSGRPPVIRPASDCRSPLDFLTVREVYYLWLLAGGDVMAELRNHGLMITTPPVISTCTLVTGEGQEFGAPRQRAALYDKTIITLPLQQLINCLSSLSRSDLLPTLSELRNAEPNKLPLIIREKDVRFQCRRTVAYRRLLQGYPFRKALIREESLHDIVPMYRANIWSALLGINYDTLAVYNSIDKDTANPVDRQIEVDIPRCHQYNELLASQQGHRKLKRVLKAWVVSNPHLVYWQGLDSLAAPFLLLNFTNESAAWACLSSFIPKYLYNMFQKDNAAVIQEYLAKFSHLQAFYDPALFNHLDEIGFIPDLYAIPWVLTMFSHVFPLHKIFHLWDTLLLGNSGYPLCVGLAILLQLRAQLMESQFNECILLFSEMPSVDIDNVVSQSKLIFESIPPSLTFRAHDQAQPSSAGPTVDTANNGLDVGGLGMVALPVVTLKAEKVSRISAHDLIDLMDLRKAKYAAPKVFVLDVRLKDEFKTGFLPGAVNLPAHMIVDRNGTLPSEPALEAAKAKGRVIAVVGREKEAGMYRVAEILLRHQFARVVTVQGGIEVFRRADILVLPSLHSN